MFGTDSILFGTDSILRDLKKHYLVERFYTSAVSQRISLEKDSVFFPLSGW